MSTTWAWPVFETFHFIGLALLVGIVGMFDLRTLGMAKGLPLGAFGPLLRLAALGFVLCVITGFGFLLGFGANRIGYPPGVVPAYDVLMTDRWLQLKLLFIFLAGLNVLAYHLLGVAREIEALGPGEDAPLRAQVIAAMSLFLWIGVVWFGRLIPRNL